MFDRLASVPGNEITIGRIFRAIGRRMKSIPHNLSWHIAGLQGTASITALSGFKDIHLGRRCFIMGNGPSLAEMDLSPLENEITFGLNRVYIHFDRMHFMPSYLVCMNELVLEQSAADLAELELPRFFNWNRRGLFYEQDGLNYLREVYRPHFSKDIRVSIWGGATVTFAALQVAYYMGVEQVILIGVDHSFSAEGTPHKTVTSGGNDTNHFNAEYFPEGFRWQLPDLTTSEYAFALAKEAFEADGRVVFDATVGGQLRVFPKVDFKTLF